MRLWRRRGPLVPVARGKTLDALAAQLGLRRKPVVLFGCSMPWKESDRKLRRRCAEAFRQTPLSLYLKQQRTELGKEPRWPWPK